VVSRHDIITSLLIHDLFHWALHSLKCFHYSPTTASMYYDGWMTLQLGRCKSVLLQSVLGVCKHRFWNALWLTIFCALLLCDCACDMDRKSAIKIFIIVFLLLLKKTWRQMACLPRRNTPFTATFFSIIIFFQDIKEKQNVYSPQLIFACFFCGPRVDQMKNFNVGIAGN